VRDALKRSCAESKRARKETFKLFFSHHDIFSIATPLLFSDSNEGASGLQPLANGDFVDRITLINNDSLSYQFAYLVNVMACEPLGINYLGQKKRLLKETIWPLLSQSKTTAFEKLAIAIFQKFSLKKRFCL
jgi:hypothetical protein